MEPAAPALEVCSVNKWFGRNQANRDVTLTVAGATIHGIVGENGAGKSTIMNVVYGTLPADSGEIRVKGRRLACRSPRDAIAAGIGMVHQHFMLVETFTALETLVLGAEGGVRLEGGLARARAELARLSGAYGLEVPLDIPVADMAVGTRQRLEILKALVRGAELLILDEPTAVLTPQETAHLFRILRALRDQGRTVIVISHKLREIMALTDRVTVMRGGAVVAEVATADTSPDHLAELMVGRRVQTAVARAPARPGASVLAVDGLQVRDDSGALRVKGVDFGVRAGEIVGVAGVSGNGQGELLEALAGMRPAAGGTIRLHGKEIAGGAGGLRRARVAHVPEDRLRVGLVTGFAAWENGLLGYHDDAAYNGRILLHRRAAVALCRARMEAYDIRPRDAGLRAGSFSGGNQQKLVLAREIEHDPDLLLVGQPTRGVDIGAIEFIHRRLIELRERGKAVLLVSTELDEILALADRILVMFDGRLVGDLAAGEADERRLGLMMTGAAA